MTMLLNDLKHGFRMLARNPGFTAVVLLVIGVSVGANTALFNAMDQVYMRPLPAKRPHELASVQFRFRHAGWEFINGTCSYPTYEAYRDQSEVFADLAAFTGSDLMDLRIGDEITRVHGTAISANYFPSLGLQPALGRLWSASQNTSDPVAVISHGLWHRWFAGRDDAIGKQVILDNRPLTIVGVAPAGFTGTIVGRESHVYLPLAVYAEPEGLRNPNVGWLHLLGRLKPDTGRDQAQAALQVLDTQMKPAKPGEPEIRPIVLEGSQGFVPGDAQIAAYPLGMFLGIAALVLVIACANVANLQLSRAVTRQKEIAIRQAIGAGRWRIVRQLMSENLTLALAAGAFGILLTIGLNRILCAVLPQLVSGNMPAEIHLRPGLHHRVLLFALVTSVGTGIAFGLAPALQMIRRDVIPALKEPNGLIPLPKRRWNPRNALIVAQIAIAAIVTVFSVLCLGNLIGLKRTNSGFDPERILAVTLSPEIWPTHDRPDLRQFMKDLHDRVRGLPCVESICLAGNAPLSEGGSMTQMKHIEGYDLRPGQTPNIHHNVVSGGYFQTMGQALVAGRDFTAHDGPDSASVMIVDELFAKRYWPNQSPIGKHVTLTSALGRATPVWEIVGVVKPVKLRSILEASRPWAYLPLAQQPSYTPAVLIRTEGNPRALAPTIRDQATRIQPAPACVVGTIAERLWDLLLPQRILTAILNSFALVGLLLSATGIYAVMTYAVKQRTSEIGIRIALGARDRHILTPILLRGTFLLALGLAFGLGISIIGIRILSSQLIHVQRWDKFFLSGIDAHNILTYVSAALPIVIVTFLACYLPVRRAARIDPMEALRCE